MVLWVRSVGTIDGAGGMGAGGMGTGSMGAGSMGTGQKRLALHMPPGLLVRSSGLAGVRG
jgi:hypothetical protein